MPLDPMPLDLRHLPGLSLRKAPDGEWHGLWRPDGREHRFWLPTRPPAEPASYRVALPLYDLAGPPAKAARAFWHTVMGKPSSHRDYDLTSEARRRHVLILRALDGRQVGASLRELAEVLLNFRGAKEDWESDPRRNGIRRIVRRGEDYLRGGYRRLLFPPARHRRDR